MGQQQFRAYRFGPGGEIAERHQAEAGILTVKDGAFEATLLREIGNWIDADTDILLSA